MTAQTSPDADHLHLAPESDEGLALRYYDVVSADGTRLQAWTNDVEGPTVLLCNGLGTNPYAWPGLLDPGCRVRVISWNHRGVAGSERPRDRRHVGVDAFVEDAVAVMDDAGVISAPVMGWSIGVNTAFELAIRHPDRVTALMAVAGVPGNTFASMGAPILLPSLLRKPTAVLLALLANRAHCVVGSVVNNLPITPLTTMVLSHSGFMLPTPDPALTRRCVRLFLAVDVEWYTHLALHASRHLRVSLSSIEVPASFVAGRWDLLADTAHLRTASEHMPGSAYVELPGTHFLPLERPVEVHAALLELLERVL